MPDPLIIYPNLLPLHCQKCYNNDYNNMNLMSINEGRHFRTHTIRFMRKDLKEQRNCRSLFSRFENKRRFYCGSLLQMVKHYEKQRKDRQKSQDNRLLTIVNDPDREKVGKQSQQKQQNRRFPQFAHQNPFKVENKAQYRIKDAGKTINARRQQQKLEFDKLINDLNTKTKEILSRKQNSHLRRSVEKNVGIQPKSSQIQHNFYQFRTTKNFKQTLSTKQESEDLDINYMISPW